MSVSLSAVNSVRQHSGNALVPGRDCRVENLNTRQESWSVLADSTGLSRSVCVWLLLATVHQLRCAIEPDWWKSSLKYLKVAICM